MNYDAIIIALAFIMFIFGWIAASINHRHHMKTMRELVTQTKLRANQIYEDGWQDGWDSLAQNPNAMRKEIAAHNRTTPRED